MTDIGVAAAQGAPARSALVSDGSRGFAAWFGRLLDGVRKGRRALTAWERRKVDERFFRCQMDLVRATFDRCDPALAEDADQVRRKAYRSLEQFFASEMDALSEDGRRPPMLARLYQARSWALLLASDGELRQTIALCTAEIGKVQDLPALNAEAVIPEPKPPKVDDDEAAQNRARAVLFARAQYLVDRLYSLVRNIKEREYARQSSAYQVVIAFGLLSCLACALYLLLTCGMSAIHPLAWWIMVFGGLGASASILQRIQKAVMDDYSVAYLVRLRHGWLSLWLSVALGAVFAFVLMLVFCSGLAGVVFSDAILSSLPVVQPFSPAQPGFKLLDFGQQGLTLNHISRILLFSFLAGFSERLVPDVLTRIEAEALAGQARKGGN